MGNQKNGFLSAFTWPGPKARPSYGIDVSVCLSVCVFVCLCLCPPSPIMQKSPMIRKSPIIQE